MIHAPQAPQVDLFFLDILHRVAAWMSAIEPLFADAAAPPARRDVDAAVEPLALALLARADVPLAGAGFVAAHGVIADAPWHMAWWQGRNNEQLLLSSVESVGEVYSRREWFTVPLQTGRSHVTGPYVDFICTDEYTLTLTQPVAAAGRVVGVVGADIFVESLESLLLPVLQDLHSAATLVNRSGRVVISADPQLAAGAMLVSGRWDEDISARVALREAAGAGREGILRPSSEGLPLAIVLPVRGGEPA